MPYKVLTVVESDPSSSLERQLEDDLNRAEEEGWDVLTIEQLPPVGRGSARILLVLYQERDDETADRRPLQ